MEKELNNIVNLQELEEEMKSAVEEDRLYWLRNSAKIRAATTGTVDYEQFRQLVCAAHLKPLEKKDAVDRSDQRVVWNPLFKKKQSF